MLHFMFAAVTLSAALVSPPQDGVSLAGSPSKAATGPLDPAIWTTVGSRIPSLQLPRVDDGSLVDLASFRGRRLLLIHFASW